HDELTLSALHESERASLQEVYAHEQTMRLNHGIRRRLGNLLGHNQARLILAHALLLSLPGTPVLYYGDEIGMSDNVELPDRDGLRTPMQWDDHTYGNASVEGQTGVPGSLLEQVRQLIIIRQRQDALRHGGIDFLATEHASVLAFVRHTSSHRVLVLANLSGWPAKATLDVGALDAVPTLVDLLDSAYATASVPGVSYSVTLAPYATRWLSLVPAFAG